MDNVLKEIEDEKQKVLKNKKEIKKIIIKI